MPSKAKTAFLENSKDITELWKIHQEVAGQGPGRKVGVEVLNRSAIVFITACWESYIEDLAIEAFDFLLTNAPTPSAVPQKVRAAASAKFWEQKDPTKVWDLAEGGWKVVLAAHRTVCIERWLGPFNTPKTAQVDVLYLDLLGIKSFSSGWSWQGISAQDAAKKLDKFISVRGDIAHRLKASAAVQKHLGINYHDHVKSLVNCCDRIVHAHLQSQTGTAPW